MKLSVTVPQPYCSGSTLTPEPQKIRAHIAPGDSEIESVGDPPFRGKFLLTSGIGDVIEEKMIPKISY